MSKVYALLVGINRYSHPGIDLTGAVNDINLFSGYLKEVIPEDQLELETLLDSQATKAKVVEQLRSHFKDARPEDTLIFHFSGHGCQEDAHPAFLRYTGEKIEALVCSDSFESSTTLADVEIRYLFHEIEEKTKARIIFVTDACNSGGASRNLSEATKRLGPFAKQREWDQFIFAAKDQTGKPIISQKMMEASSDFNEILKQGRHIHLAACESHESALELKKQNGLFTANLIEILKNTNGKITFEELTSRVKYLLKTRFKQTPTLYAFQDGKKLNEDEVDEDIRDSEFLSGVQRKQSQLINVYFLKGKWVIPKGAVHGMPPLQQAGNIVVNIFEEASKKVLATGKITEVRPSDSVFEPDPAVAIREEDVILYKAEVQGLYVVPFKVLIDPGVKGIKALLDFAKNNPEKLTEKNIQFTEERITAKCQVVWEDEEYIITSPDVFADRTKTKAWVKTTKGDTDDSFSELLEHLGKIAHWYFVRDLHNPKPPSQLSKSIEWEVIAEPGTGVLLDTDLFDPETQPEISFNPDVDASGNTIRRATDFRTIDLHLPAPETGKIAFVKLRVRLKNVSEKLLYVSLLYIGQAFDVSAGYLTDHPEVVPLTGGKSGIPGKTIWAFGNSKEGNPFVLKDFIIDDEWEAETFYIKLLICEEEFELGNGIEQDALPLPGITEGGKKAGFRIPGASKHPPMKSWVSKMVAVSVLNPFLGESLR